MPTNIKNSKIKLLKKVRNAEKRSVDSIFLILVFALLAFGLIMLFSSSFARAYTYKGNSFYYITRQAFYAAVGVVGMLFISKFNYNRYKRWSITMFVVALILLVVVLFMHGDANGIKRWINIGPLQFQPSEFMKFALIVLFSSLISTNYNKMKKFSYGVLMFAAIISVVVFLMIKEPHLSGTVLICVISGILMFVGGTKPKWFITLFIIAGVAMLCLLIFGGSYMSDRAYFWLHPFSDPQNKTMQTDQSLLAIGSGKFFGLGLGQSRQKFMYLPEVQNDFIFAIVCEELGIMGAFAIMILFLLFCYKGFEIASKAPNKFGFLICTGIVAQIGIQAILNIAVVTATVPNTGISLPFFSYGGTALVMQLLEMGIVLNISKYSTTAKINTIKMNSPNIKI